MSARRLASLLLLAAPGCGLFNQPGPDGGAPTKYGYSGPTIEVTIAGVHFGPAAPDPGYSATLVDQHDGSTGAVVSSTFTATASTGGALCSIAVQRQGEGVVPIGVASYFLAANAGGATPDGKVEPVSGESASTAQAAWQCAGDDCDNTGFVLSALDASHVAGWISGTWPSLSGDAPADVACSFWLPITDYQP